MDRKMQMNTYLVNTSTTVSPSLHRSIFIIKSVTNTVYYKWQWCTKFVKEQLHFAFGKGEMSTSLV
jgi:hypothetical protein